MKKVTIYSDGGCEGNPGPGGWGIVLLWNGLTKELSGGEAATTNNRMELLAAIEALKALKEPCEIIFHTDSEYVRKGITQWIAGWKAKGWVTMKREPVKNADLWRELDRQRLRHKVEWRWVKGHAGNIGNERCDTLASEAIAAIHKRYGREGLKTALEAFKRASAIPSLF